MFFFFLFNATTSVKRSEQRRLLQDIFPGRARTCPIQNPENPDTQQSVSTILQVFGQTSLKFSFIY